MQTNSRRELNSSHNYIFTLLLLIFMFSSLPIHLLSCTFRWKMFSVHLPRQVRRSICRNQSQCGRAPSWHSNANTIKEGALRASGNYKNNFIQLTGGWMQAEALKTRGRDWEWREALFSSVFRSKSYFFSPAVLLNFLRSAINNSFLYPPSRGAFLFFSFQGPKESSHSWYKNRNVVRASMKARQMITWIFGKEDSKFRNCENLQVL